MKKVIRINSRVMAGFDYPIGIQDFKSIRRDGFVAHREKSVENYVLNKSFRVRKL